MSNTPNANEPTAKAVALHIARAVREALLWRIAVGLGATIVTLVLLNWFIGCDASQPSACVLVPWVTTQEIP